MIWWLLPPSSPLSPPPLPLISHPHFPILPLIAGKVHGSLARAGKVRGQTPKVPKQDKQKKPTGRALKRLKYNRRFVNVGTFYISWLSTIGGFTIGTSTPSYSYSLTHLFCYVAVVGFGKKRGPNSQ